MSRRTSIVLALAEKLKVIDGSAGYKSNVFDSVSHKLKFWDECNSFPCIYVVAGTESREYLPAAFAWGFLNISLVGIPVTIESILLPTKS